MHIRWAKRDKDIKCKAVLEVLPDWFGIETAREHYILHAASAPMCVAEIDGKVVGYISICDHFGRNCELHSMGVLPEHHRQGIGQRLLKSVADWASDTGFDYLSVKTLSDEHPDPN